VRVLSDAMVGFDSRSLAKNAVFWLMFKGECVRKKGESGELERKRSLSVCDTCNGTGGEGKGKQRDAVKERANHGNAKLTSLRLEPQPLLPHFTSCNLA
jgi:hypothetical protein